MDERVMIFIDGSNLYHSLKSHFNRADLDLGKFTRKLLQKRQLVRIYYYNAAVGQKQEPEVFKQQQAFFAGINAVPYTELRLGRLVYTSQWPSVPPYEKGTDVQLATDMITHSYKSNYDVAILVAGDNDFAGAVQAVKDNGKHVEVALFGNPGTSLQLREVADMVLSINSQVLKDCWTRQPQKRRQSQSKQPTEPPQPQQQPEPPQEPQPPEPQAQEPQPPRKPRKPRRRRPRQSQPNQNQTSQDHNQPDQPNYNQAEPPNHNQPNEQQPQHNT